MAAAENTVATETQSSERSIRDDILAAREEVESRTSGNGDSGSRPDVATETPAKPRDREGRFVSPQAATPAAAETDSVEHQEAPAETGAQAPQPDDHQKQPDTQGVAPQPQGLAAPPSWSYAVKAKWAELPQDVRAEIAKREAEVHRGFTKMDEERAYGRELQKVIAPYEPLIRAEGGTPAAAVQDLLNTAYILRTADPATKARLFAQTAQRFGVDLSQLGQAQQPVDPTVAQLQNKLAQLEGTLAQQRMMEQERVQQTALQTIQAFRSDPAHPFFEAVQDHMAVLLQNNQANDLNEAYEMAVWARPDLRQQLLAQQAQQPASNQQRQKAEKARIKGVSVRGGPGGTQPAAPNPNASVREDLMAALEEARGRI